MTNTIKNILTAVIVVVIIFVAFKLFVPEKEESAEGAFKSTTLNNSLIFGSIEPTKEVAITLIKLKAVKIDKELFSKDTFNSLEDFRVTVFPEDVGRNNPFALIGTD